MHASRTNVTFNSRKAAARQQARAAHLQLVQKEGLDRKEKAEIEALKATIEKVSHYIEL